MLGSLFTDHAVLQRDMVVPVWGKAEPGREVVVQFAAQEKTGHGRQRWSLDGETRSDCGFGRRADAYSEDRFGRCDNHVSGCARRRSLGLQRPIQYGDARGGASNGPEVIAAAGDAKLRLFGARAQATDEPQEAIGGSWAIDSPQSAAGFSAVAYFFGQELRKKLGVPVGLIQSAVGGTVAEAWTARADLESNPTLKYLLDQQASRVADYPRLLAAYTEREPDLLTKYEEELAKAKAAGVKEPNKPQPPHNPADNNRPTGLYNGSIAPLVPYAIRGVIWYQGESNNGRAKEYETLFPAMIASWRKVWGQGDFPFLFVQIAPHNNMTPEIREAQRVTTETTPNTAMAVTTDIGDAVDIHPKRKQPIGVRLALAARALAYGEPVEYSGPTLDGLSIAGNRAILIFKHVGDGLVAKDGELKGFTIAGADGNFVPAKATIDGETIVVSSDAIATPTKVRYGWANVPDVNLYNKADLPASPFRDRADLQTGRGFRTVAEWKRFDRLALRWRRLRRQDAIQRWTLHGPRRADRRQPGQGVGAVAHRA